MILQNGENAGVLWKNGEGTIVLRQLHIASELKGRKEYGPCFAAAPQGTSRAAQIKCVCFGSDFIAGVIFIVQ